MKILCASDLHLGRQPSMKAFPGHALTAQSAWDFVVASALREQADLLILAGDLVERDNRYFEAWAPLKAGVIRLLEAGVTLAAIAGNHDSEVLPRLHDDLRRDLAPDLAARFLLLGRQDGRMGVWTQETVTLGAETLRLVGWSFPAPRHSADPLHDFPALSGEFPSLGILHGDLDLPASPYAPFSSAELRQAGPDRWVLGHIHAPSARDGAPFYCGSPLPLRASETGAHGCWLLTLKGRAWSEPVLVPAPIRIEALEVPLTPAQGTEAEVQSAILQAMRAAIHACQDTNPLLQGMLFRVRLTGEATVAALRTTEDFTFALDGVEAAIHGDVENLTRPPRSLEQWLSDPGARGLLARLIQDLERGAAPEEWRDLVDEIAQLEKDSRAAGAYLSLDTRWKDETTAAPDWDRDLLKRACLRLFKEMIPVEAPNA